MTPWIRPIVDFLEGAGPHPSLPVDLQGTVFQRRVWEALRGIPLGQTRTYSEVAAQLGRPRAQRAVGQACSRNKLAILVPCHRVLPMGQPPGSYRWGPERKRLLLDLERRKNAEGHHRP